MFTRMKKSIGSWLLAAISSAVLVGLAGCASGGGESGAGEQPAPSQPPASPTAPSQPSNPIPPASAEALEADWVARSAANGVIFAHDFRDTGEVRAFIRNATREADATGRDVYAVPAVGKSKALFHQIMGTSLAASVSASTKGAIEVFQLTDGSKWPVAVAGNASTEYHASVSDLESVRIMEGPWRSGSAWYIRVNRASSGSAVAHPAGTAIATWNTEWERILTALPAGQNGKSTNDPGYGKAGNAGPGNWNPGGANAHYNYRGGYWAHASTIATYGANGAWTSDKGTIPNAFNGDEFYIQYRVRFSASKWAGADPVARSGKSFYLQTASGSSAQQMYVPIGGSGQSVYYSGEHSTDPFVVVLDGQNPGSHYETAPWGGRDLSDSSYGGRTIQPGSVYESSCKYASRGSVCWMWPADKWVTVLLHIKPSGVNFYRRTAKLAAPLTSEPYYLSDGVTRNYPTSVIAVEAGSLANWPDPAEYPYYIQIKSAGSAVTPTQGGIQYEVVQVTDIDYVNSTLTVKRNIWRTTKNVNVTHPATSSFLYGMSGGGKSYGWLNDPRLSPHKDGLIDIKVAVEGETEYTQVFYMDNVPMMYGDNSSTYGDFSQNAPGFNSFRASHYANLPYSLSGALSSYSTAEYTQIILSKDPIACPQVWN